MTEPAPLEHLHQQIAQAMFDEAQRRAGLPPYPLDLSRLHRDEYLALAAVVMPSISAFLAAAFAGDPTHSWHPDARPACEQRNADNSGPLTCDRTDAHTPGRGCTFAASVGIHTKASEAVDG